MLIYSCEANSTFSLCFGFFNEGSAEDQQLQAVAEDVAASVLHLRTPSNPVLHARDISCRENIEDGGDQNNLIDVQRKAETQVILFTYSSVFVLSSL